MKFIFKHRKILVLTGLTILGAVLRFWKLDSFPVAPNWDEVSHGYNAYSILMSGKDEWGRNFPFIFRAFGDFKLPVYIYLSTIPIWLFGLNEFSIRFVSALSGTLAIPGIYLLVKELSSSTKFAIVSALLLTISPWHFFISRPALEANLSLTLIIYGFYFLARFFRNRSSLIPSVILLGLSLHAYNTARIFVPLMVLVSFLIYRPKLKPNTKTLFSFLLMVCFSSLVIFQIYLGEGTARYEKLKILSPSVVFQIGEKRTESRLPTLLAKAIYNRPVFFMATSIKNYFSYFSPDFFSQKWGAQFQFAIPNKNLLTLPVYLLAILGFLAFLPSLRGAMATRQSHSTQSFQFLYSWLLLSPVAASLTIDPPQALRPNPMIPALVVFAVLGFCKLLSLIPIKTKNVLSLSLIVLIIFSFISYLLVYYGSYAKDYSSSWQYGYHQVMTFVRDHQSEYDRIFITKRFGEPHIFYSFYNQASPNTLQPGLENIRYSKSDWFWTDKIGQVYFVNDWQIPLTTVRSLPLESGGEVSTQRSLLITSSDHIPVNAHVIERINFLDGTPAFIITSIP